METGRIPPSLRELCVLTIPLFGWAVLGDRGHEKLRKMDRPDRRRIAFACPSSSRSVGCGGYGDTRGNRRNTGEPRHGLGDVSSDQQGGQKPAFLDSLDRPVRPLGLAGTGTSAREDRLRLPGQGAPGVARLGADVGVPGDVLFVVASPAIPSPMAAGYRREDRHYSVRERSRVGSSRAG